MRRLRLFLIGVRVSLAAGALALACAAGASAAVISLQTGSSAPTTYSSWRPNQGESDGFGSHRDGLVFQKGLSTPIRAAATATIKGVRGRSIQRFTSSSTALAWDRRNDGHCSAGAPRWNLRIEGQSGRDYLVFLACTYATHTPGAEPEAWTRDAFGGAQIRQEILRQIGSSANDALRGTIKRLAIVFDEGPESTGVGGSPGRVVLDNIAVGARVWTSRYS